MALKAIDEVPFEARENTSITMAIDPSLLPKARKLIREFRRNICNILQAGNKKENVYHLSIALIPATNNFKITGELNETS